MSVRQSNDCTLARAARPAARIAAATAVAKASGSGVSAPEVGVILVSMLKRTWSAPARAHELEQLGQRRNARAVGRPLLGKGRRIGAARLEPADVVALHSASVSERIGGPSASRNWPSGRACDPD